MGRAIFRVVPTAIVDSIITSVPFFKFSETMFKELIKGSRSGLLSCLMGVGTQMQIISHSLKSSGFEVTLYPKFLSLFILFAFSELRVKPKTSNPALTAPLPRASPT